MPPSPELVRLVDHQLGVATRRQLLVGGLTPAEVRWKLGRSWRLLLPGVVLLDPGLPSPEQRDVAALLYAGPSSWLAGPSALLRHGVDPGEGSRRTHVLVPAPLRTRDVSWVSVRRTIITDERVVERGPLRWSCLPRAVVDSAAAAGHDSVARSAPSDPRRGRSGCVVGSRGRPGPAPGHVTAPTARLAQPRAEGPRGSEAHDAGPVVRRRGHGRDGAEPALPRGRAAVGRHRRPVCRPVRAPRGRRRRDPGGLARDPAAVLARVEAARHRARASGERPGVTAVRRERWERAAG